MMQVFDCQQGTDEWKAARLGLPTASEFAKLLGIKKEAKDKLTRQAYMRRLAGEILTGEIAETYSNGHMDRGKEMEQEARDLYAFITGNDPQQVGFVRNGNAGCSPDALIGTNGGLELKSRLPHIQIELLESGTMPGEHRAQVQGCIWLCEREWWDFGSYCPKLPLFMTRIPRDDGYIATLVGAVAQFNDELNELVERVRRYGAPPSKIPADLLMAG